MKSAVMEGCAVMERAAVLEPKVDTVEKTLLIPQWKVILLDDDVTTIDFVVELIVSIFRKPHDEAVKLTNEVHETGSAIVVITSLERAELYVDQVKSLARPRGFPLTATLEPA